MFGLFSLVTIGFQLNKHTNVELFNTKTACVQYSTSSKITIQTTKLWDMR